jgi:hypothetical protein
MNQNSHFTFKNLESQYAAVLEQGYEFMTCAEYLLRKHDLPRLTVVNCVDIDFSIKKSERLSEPS